MIKDEQNKRPCNHLRLKGAKSTRTFAATISGFPRLPGRLANGLVRSCFWSLDITALLCLVVHVLNKICLLEDGLPIQSPPAQLLTAQACNLATLVKRNSDKRKRYGFFSLLEAKITHLLFICRIFPETQRFLPWADERGSELEHKPAPLFHSASPILHPPLPLNPEEALKYT